MEFRVLWCIVIANCAIWGCVFATFFLEILYFTEEESCKEHMDCFALNSSTRKIITQSPIQDNCSQFENSLYIIESYQLSFHLKWSLVSALDMFAAGHSVLCFHKIFGSFFLMCFKRKSCGLVGFVSVEVLLVMVVTFILSLQFSLAEHYSKFILSSPKYVMEFCLYSVAFILITVMAIISFILIFLKQLKKEKQPLLLMHHAEVVEHAEIVIYAEKVETTNRVGPSESILLTSTLGPQKHKITAKNVKKAKLVIQTSLVQMVEDLLQPHKITMASGVLPVDS